MLSLYEIKELCIGIVMAPAIGALAVYDKVNSIICKHNGHKWNTDYTYEGYPIDKNYYRCHLIACKRCPKTQVVYDQYDHIL
jgi:hypothetical protein